MLNKELKKSLYESIMKDVAKVIKHRLNELNTFEIIDDFDVRDYFPGYQKIKKWIESVGDESNLEENDNTLKEALEPNFENNLESFININLKKYSRDAVGLTHVTPKVKYVHFQLPAGPLKLMDVVLSDPDKNRYVPIITHFMKIRNYTLIYFFIRLGRLHIIYTDNEAVKVNFSDLYNNPEFDGKIYHVTPYARAEDILINGFNLSSRKNFNGITYSPRIYFFTTRKSALQYENNVKSEHKSKELALVSVPVDSIQNIDFFYDPVTEQFEGIYTETPIENINDIKMEEL